MKEAITKVICKVFAKYEVQVADGSSQAIIERSGLPEDASIHDIQIDRGATRPVLPPKTLGCPSVPYSAVRLALKLAKATISSRRKRTWSATAWEGSL